MPKNHAKVRGGTREDVNGRVHTKLIQKLQSGAIDVKKMIARQKKQNEPLPPPPGVPRSTGGSSSHDFPQPRGLNPVESRDYNYGPPAVHSQPERGVIYPSVQLKAIGDMHLDEPEPEMTPPEENSTQNGSEKVIIKSPSSF